jgi:predicted transcriptional regulator
VSNRKYTATANHYIPRPKFTPGIDAKTTGILLLAGTTLGLATVYLAPSNQDKTDSAIYDVKPNQFIIVDQAPRLVQENTQNTSAIIPYSEYASLVSSALGLGKSDIARILGISRPTLYSWIKGSSEPRESDHPDRLRQLGELTDKICRETKRPLYHRFVEEPLPNQTNSILKLLLAENWNLAEIRQLLAEARRLTTERDQRLGHAIPINTSKSRLESNLLDNAISLNLE